MYTYIWFEDAAVGKVEKKRAFQNEEKKRIWSEAQEIQKGWTWGKMLPFTFCSLHEIQLALSMISFRSSLVYFKILYIVQRLLTWWIKKILARGRMSHSDTFFWESSEKEGPHVGLSIIYLEWIQRFDWWLSTVKLPPSYLISYLVLSTVWLIEDSFRLTSRDKELCDLITPRDLVIWCNCYFKIFESATIF